MTKKGYWGKEHKYYRLNVEDYIDEFCGWGPLNRLIQYFPPGRDRSFFCTLFETGGRVTEVLGLTVENFTVIPTVADPTEIVIENMALEKRYHKVEKIKKPNGKSGWQTEKLYEFRKPFSILAKEPPAKVLLEHLQTCRGLLFPSNYGDRAALGLALTRSWAYKLIRWVDTVLPGDLHKKLGLDRRLIDKKTQEVIADKIHLWLHWFRSQRASQLVSDYQLDVLDLVDYFSWEDEKTAIHYARKGVRLITAKMKAANVSYA
jgi:hypothetical protein